MLGAQQIVNKRTADELYATLTALQGTLKAAERTMRQDETMVEARKRLAPIAGARISVLAAGGPAPAGLSEKERAAFDSLDRPVDHLLEPVDRGLRQHVDADELRHHVGGDARSAAARRPDSARTRRSTAIPRR